MKRLNVDRARGLRQTMTDAERGLWRYARNRQLSGFRFRRQHEIDRYIVDFVCTGAWLIVELDGGQHVDQVEYDARRTQRLKVMGYRVLRFWNNGVMVNIEGVLEVVMSTLASPTPHPNPLPRGERGQRATTDESE